ncbi:hypothetical protein [Brucella anthropi]|uniref:hypothetical protein n=1 Tax=Brucella anthropi TaxID=529 RepID=UPI003D98A4CC
MKRLSLSERDFELMMTASQRAKSLTQRLDRSAVYKEAITKKQITLKKKSTVAA